VLLNSCKNTSREDREDREGEREREREKERGGYLDSIDEHVRTFSLIRERD
jgi:hypothetical protein